MNFNFALQYSMKIDRVLLYSQLKLSQSRSIYTFCCWWTECQFAFNIYNNWSM